MDIGNSDSLIVKSQADLNKTIEKIYLSDNNYIDKSRLDIALANLRLKASELGIVLNRENILSNPELVSIIRSSWQIERNDTHTPPLVLDINSNSITSSSLVNSNTYFDYDGDGVREKTGWIESGDGLLAIDIDKNSLIDKGSELFGTHFKLSNSSYAKDGYEALRDFDSNKDNIIDENDEKFKDLIVWMDNENGISEKGELKTLKELGISQIHLPDKENFSIVENENIITNESTFKQNSTSKSIKDVWFKFSPTDAKSNIPIEPLYDNNFTDIIIDSNNYVDETKILSQASIKELIINSGYTGIGSSGTSAKANANNGTLTLENRWFKSDNLDTIYDKNDLNSSDSNLKGSGNVRDLDDAANSNLKLKEDIKRYEEESTSKAFDELSKDMDNILDGWALNDNFGSNNSFVPPIVLDLNSNGITSTDLNKTDIYFDYKNIGRRDKTAWIDQGDGLLGVDINKDRIINNSYELFGSLSKLSNGSYAKDGYEALRDFDSNKDNIIDENDEKFKDLLVWQDLNLDGKSTKEEVKSLKDVGISSLSLEVSNNTTFENGNRITGESLFQTSNGKTGIVRDVWFKVSDKHSIAVSELSDEYEKKISIVEAFRGSRLTNEQRANPYIVLAVLKEYDNIKFATMSKILSNRLFGENTKSCQLMFNALNLKLERIINHEANETETALAINLLSAALKRDYNYAIFKINKNYLVNEKIQTLLAKTGISFKLSGKDIVGTIGKYNFATKSSENFDFSSSKNGISIEARGGNDTIIGSNFNDEINGGNGNDIIFGSGGMDILRGAAGNDLLIGSKDNTIYEYYLGDGDDIVIDDGGRDVLRFAFLKPEDVSIQKSGNDMIIRISNPFDKNDILGNITIKNGYTTGKIEQFYFDGKILSFEEILEKVSADTIYKFNKFDGVVTIDDIGGVDRVLFGDGISFDSIIVNKLDTDLEIAIKIDGRKYDELTDKLVIKNFFNSQGRIESFVFSNGAILNHEEILKDLSGMGNDKFIIGDKFDNTLNGTENANIINGKEGNDTLNGLNGDDKYIFEISGGKDTISDTGGLDKIIFGFDINRDNLQGKISGDDLIVGIKESGVAFDNLKDKITIKNWNNPENKIERVAYSDGSEYDIETLLNRAVKFDQESISMDLKNQRSISSFVKAFDPDGGDIIYEIISNPQNGTFALQKDGAYSYKANEGFVGVDKVVIKASDMMGSEALLNINFNISVTIPIIGFSSNFIKEDEILRGKIEVIADVPNDNIKYELIGNPKNGIFTINSDGSYEYRPEINFNGKDSVEIKVSNSYGISSKARLEINVEAVNDLPLFNSEAEVYELKNTNIISSKIEAIDVDGDKLTYSIVSNAANGKFNIDEEGNFSYKANADFLGLDSVMIGVSDGKEFVKKELKFNILGYQYDGGDMLIDSSYSNNTIKISKSNISDIDFSRHIDDLLLHLPNGTITISKYFNKNKTVSFLEFKDGTKINISNDNLQESTKSWWQLKPSVSLKHSGIVFGIDKKENINGSKQNDVIITSGGKDNVDAGKGNDIIFAGNYDTIKAGKGDDTIVSRGNSATLIGSDGDDVYIISSKSNNNIIKDKELINLINGGNDTIRLSGDITKQDITFSRTGTFSKDLLVRYKDNSLIVKNQSNKYSAVEKLELDNGNYITRDQIDKIIQDINAFAKDNGISSINHDTIRNNNDMMNIVMNGWIG
ncbi:Ig-like domain-containing protein [Campylobacter sp. RM16188]|uniref:Ig-like domain-containing protein n=1 Tax=Campylobacter sp. RM16188 TaxID=1705725 RepID=UPI001C12F9D4|nr:Ig-like domain-containing protein [Campylobacter sp. RM16188]